MPGWLILVIIVAALVVLLVWVNRVTTRRGTTPVDPRRMRHPHGD